MGGDDRPSGSRRASHPEGKRKWRDRNEPGGNDVNGVNRRMTSSKPRSSHEKGGSNMYPVNHKMTDACE